MSRVAGSKIEVRAGSPEGQLLGTAEVPQNQSKDSGVMDKVTAQINNAGVKPQDLYFVFRNTAGTKENILILDWVYFDGGKQTLSSL
jgi:hypothetical protein